MRVNPGGNLSPAEVVGRDRFIQKLWRILKRQSLVLTAERRMGKTSVIKKMVAESPEGAIAIYRDLEGTRTAIDFVKRVFDDVEQYLNGFQKSSAKMRAFLESLSGIELGGVVKIPDQAAPHWNMLLRKTIEDLLDHHKEPFIFFWDELPLMLYDIKDQENEGVAQEILDVLRSLRQTHPQLRMVFTGSIGLHNVLTKLKRAGYANDPTNDMRTLDVPPLSTEDAVALAMGLMAGEQIDCADLDVLAKEIAIAADNIPFFIHQLVDHIAFETEDLRNVEIQKILNHYMLDSSDPWHLRYYRERIDTYYPNRDQALALGVLDILAIASTPLSFDEICSRLPTQTNAFDEESTRDILTLLQRDHYVHQPEVNAHEFRFSLIRKSWKIHRGLT